MDADLFFPLDDPEEVSVATEANLENPEVESLQLLPSFEETRSSLIGIEVF